MVLAVMLKRMFILINSFIFVSHYNRYIQKYSDGFLILRGHNAET